jgi:hypothetical protein
MFILMTHLNKTNKIVYLHNTSELAEAVLLLPEWTKKGTQQYIYFS